MTRCLTRPWLVFIIPLLCAYPLACRNTQSTRTSQDLPPTGLKPTVIAYVEQDAFDALFEIALVNQDPVIIIQTETSRPDWGARLNAWIAAWNRGSVVPTGPRLKVRMQAPLAPVTVNGETLREFRLLIDDLMKRAEELTHRGSSWWTEERTQRRRIALLKAYSLRFHLDENENIQLIFFNGMYARFYRQFMDFMAMRDTDEPAEWSRDVKCSRCRGPTAGITAQQTRVLLGEPLTQPPK